VVEPFKGGHLIGEKITLRFHTDSLPTDPDERSKFIDAVAAKNLGALKIAFVTGGKATEHSCEWLDVVPYSAEMAAFVREHRDGKEKE
jgi:hypothetical protein